MTTSAPEKAWRTDAPVPSRRTARTLVALTAVAAVVLGVGLWQRWDARAPYGPESVDAHVTMRLVPESRAQAAVDALAGTGVLQIPVDRGPLLVGQLVLDVPPGARASDLLTLFLVDAGTRRPLAQVYGSSADGNVGQGWDASYDQVLRQVPWLLGAASPAQGGGPITTDGMALGWSGTTHGPVTFVAVPLDGTSAPASLSSYTVGLTLQREDRTLLWAQQLTPAGP